MKIKILEQTKVLKEVSDRAKRRRERWARQKKEKAEAAAATKKRVVRRRPASATTRRSAPKKASKRGLAPAAASAQKSAPAAAPVPKSAPAAAPVPKPSEAEEDAAYAAEAAAFNEKVEKLRKGKCVSLVAVKKELRRRAARLPWDTENPTYRAWPEGGSWLDVNSAACKKSPTKCRCGDKDPWFASASDAYDAADAMLLLRKTKAPQSKCHHPKFPQSGIAKKLKELMTGWVSISDLKQVADELYQTSPALRKEAVRCYGQLTSGYEDRDCKSDADCPGGKCIDTPMGGICTGGYKEGSLKDDIAKVKFTGITKFSRANGLVVIDALVGAGMDYNAAVLYVDAKWQNYSIPSIDLPKGSRDSSYRPSQQPEKK